MKNTLRLLLLRFAKLGFRLLKPFLRWLKKKYDKYKLLVPDMPYHAWATQNETLCFVDKEILKRPLVSIVVPLYNTSRKDLLETVYSVVNQHYNNWELVLVNASDAEYKQQAQDCTLIDTRIKVVDPGKNDGIAANTNFGLKQANGEYVAFLDHDDLLHPCALHAVAEQLQENNPPGLIYSDEDKISADSSLYFEPFFKPDWSPDLMENVNYINHLTVTKPDLIEKVGYLRPECDGAQDYDLLLRIIDEFKPKIMHLPLVLYHWRAAATSTAQNISTKTYVFKAGERALFDHLKRNKISAEVLHIKGKPGFYKINYEKTPYSIIVGPVNPIRYPACAAWIQKLLKNVSSHQAELIVGEWYKSWDSKNHRVSTIYIEEAKQGNKYWEEAAGKASKEVAICFKVAALPKVQDGLAKLASVANDSRHSAASPVIVGIDDTIYDAGFIKTGDLFKPMFEGLKLPKNTYYGSTELVRNPDNLSTNVIVIKANGLRRLLEDGQNYHNSTNIGAFFEREDKNYVLWAHTPFEYLGMLEKPSGSIYQTQNPLSLTQESKTNFDNWGDNYERDTDE